MPDLADQLRAYFDATTEPVDADRIPTGAARGLNGDESAGPSHHTYPRRPGMSIELENRPAPSQESRPRRRSVVAVVLAAAAVLALVAAITISRGARPDERQEPASPPPDDRNEQSPPTTVENDVADPPASDAETIEVMRAFEAAVNARDLDAIVALYAEDAVLREHPAGASVATGRDEIRLAEQANLFQMASRDEQVFWITSLETDGPRASFGQIFSSPTGCFAGTGAHAVVEDGLIREYTWGTWGLPCVRELLRDFEMWAGEPTGSMGPILAADVVMIGHPSSPTDPLVGPAVAAALRDWRAGLPPDASLEVDDVVVDGPAATFDLVGRTAGGCAGSTGHRVVAEGGHIVSWDWGTAETACGQEGSQTGS